MNCFLCALVQTNVSVGALSANADKVLAQARSAAGKGAQVVVFPELVLSGYPPEDLVLKRHFLADVEVQLARLARELPPGVVVIVGAPRFWEGAAYNCAVVLFGGEIKACYRKMLLPNYGVFDEKRVFKAGDKPLVIDVGVRLGIHICEDSWFPEGAPCTILAGAGLDGLINLSASPYHKGKLRERVRSLGAAASRVGAPMLYCNLVGGQDDLVFDGASMILAPAGVTLARGRQFGEDVVFVMLQGKPRFSNEDDEFRVVQIPVAGSAEPQTFQSLETNTVEPVLDEVQEVYEALKLGLRDYVEKNRFKKVVVALSGGIDSALVAALAVDALGPSRVAGVTMPSKFSSEETYKDAQELAKNLGIELAILPIRRLHQLFLGELTPVFAGKGPDATEENLQARIRGTLVMALSNKFGWLVLTTGNKSEMATGYCTLYGDMAGGFAVIKDVPKTLVFQLCRWRNTLGPKKNVIPVSTIERPPTAELRANQKDSDSLPPYEILDPILERYVELDESADQIIAAGFEEKTVRRVIRLVDGNEYKRRQGAPGVKITPKAFGRDRRLPITNQYNERTM